MDNRKIIREISFRGKCTDNGEWVFGVFISDALETVRGKRMLKGFIMNYDEDVEELMYTVDRNGKKVFEGDIIKYHGEYYAIRYLEKYMRFSPVGYETVSAVFDYTQSEIASNIYDNPELVKILKEPIVCE